MKTLMTSALMIALACTGISLGQEKAPLEPQKTEQKSNKKITLEDVKMMLESMGYEPKPFTNADGKVVGYSIKYESDDFTLYCDFSISGNGENLWLSGTFGKGADESAPVAAVLKMLELNDSIWPANISYLPKAKKLFLSVSTQTTNLTPAGLRTILNSYSKAIKTSVLAWEKAVADAKQKAKEPNPLP